MKKFNLKKHFFKIILLIFGIYFVYDYFENKNKIENLEYGIKANVLRKSLNIPIIDNYMSAESKHNEFFGNRWKSRNTKPKNNEILHVWKNVTPSENKKFILGKETDAYRIKKESGRIRQLNIFSEINNDFSLKQSGKIFYNTEPRKELELNKKGIDSVLKNWNLKYSMKK